jgi:hypothetical protein
LDAYANALLTGRFWWWVKVDNIAFAIKASFVIDAISNTMRQTEERPWVNAGQVTARRSKILTGSELVRGGAEGLHRYVA